MKGLATGSCRCPCAPYAWPHHYAAVAHFCTGWKLQPGSGLGGGKKQPWCRHSSQMLGSGAGVGKPSLQLMCHQSHLVMLNGSWVALAWIVLTYKVIKPLAKRPVPGSWLLILEWQELIKRYSIRKKRCLCQKD